MICPKCEAQLSNHATSCVCGWKRPAFKIVSNEPLPRVMCAYEPCPNRAACKIRHPLTGAWVNVCDAHYLVPFNEWAKSKAPAPRKIACQARGCVITNRALPGKDFCKTHQQEFERDPASVRRRGKAGNVPEARLREPGDDDETVEQPEVSL